MTLGPQDDYVCAARRSGGMVDALASGASGRKPVGVRVPPSAFPSLDLLLNTDPSHDRRFPPRRRCHPPVSAPAKKLARTSRSPRSERTRPEVTDRYHLAMAGNLRETLGQRAERNQLPMPATCAIANSPLFPDINNHRRRAAIPSAPIHPRSPQRHPPQSQSPERRRTHRSRSGR